MKILIITAHPSPLGITHAIAKTYTDAQRIKKNEVQVVDLYADNYKVDLLKFSNITEFVPSKVQLKFQEQLQWANEIVVIHPLWWGTPPSIMKNWTELTFWKGIAYKYSSKGNVEKLLHGKTAKIFTTCGGPSWYHHFIFMPLLSFWKFCVFEFCGVDVVDVKICGNLNVLKGEKREKHIQQFLRKIRNS